MSCYEKFGWKPGDIRTLPRHEADLLSIYFEELSAFQAAEQRRIENESKDANSGGFTTDFEIKDDDD